MKKRTLVLSIGLLALLPTMLWLLNREPNPPATAPVSKPSPAPNHAKKKQVAASPSEAVFHENPQTEKTDQDSEPAEGTETDSRLTHKVEVFTEQQTLENRIKLREWARQNMAEAMQWLANAPEGPDRDAVAETVCGQLAASDPEQAVSLAERYGGGCSNLVEDLVMQWAGQDETAVYTYATNKPVGPIQDGLLARIAFVRAKDNPRKAAWIVAKIQGKNAQNEAAISVLHQWMLEDPNAAMEWARIFPVGALRNRVIREVENMDASGTLNTNADGD